MFTRPGLLGMSLGFGLLLAQAPVTTFAAGTDTWTGAGADSKWSTAPNWTSGHVPVAGDDVIFPSGVTNKAASNDIAGLTLHSLTVNDVGYSISGAGVGMDDGSLATASLGSGAPVIIDLPVTVTSAHILTVDPETTIRLTALKGDGNVSVIDPHGGTILEVTGPASTFTGRLMSSSGEVAYDDRTGSPDLSGENLAAGGRVGQVTMTRTGSASFARLRVTDRTWVNPRSLEVKGLSAQAQDIVEFALNGITPGSGYSQVLADEGATVALNGAFLGINGCSATAPGDRYVLVRHLGAGATVGTFGSMPEGSASDICGVPYRATYKGGSSASDVVLIRLSATVAAVGRDDQAWTRRAPSAFHSLGANLAGAPALVRPSIEEPSHSSLEYFGVAADGDVLVRTEHLAWRGFTSGGTFSCLDNPGLAVDSRSPAQTHSRPVVVACEGAGRQLWYTSFQPNFDSNSGPLPSVAVTDWKSAGGVLTAGPAVGYVGGATIPTFFGVGQDQNIWTATPTSGFVQAPWRCTGHPSVSTQDTTTYFACHGTDGALWYDIYSGGHWRGAQSLGGNLIDGTAVVATRTGATFYVEGTDHQVWETSVSNGAQTPWLADGGYVDHGVGAAP